MKNWILFDLDGTLTDPKEGITKSVAYALESFGIHEPNLDKLTPFIGPPLLESFHEFYQFDDEKGWQAVEKYREYFEKKGKFQNQVYEGIPGLLTSLKEAGWKLGVATSKPEPYAVEILEHFDLSQYFDCVAGSDMEGNRVKKGAVIQYALEKGKISPENALMVGDRRHDILGAHEAGLEVISVLYGYGSYEELYGNGADYLVQSVDGLNIFLLEQYQELPGESGICGPVISVSQMRDYDAVTINSYVKSTELMRRAAQGIFDQVEGQIGWEGHIGILTGGGNNGGDGYALAEILKKAGHSCEIICLTEKRSPDGAHFAEKAAEADVKIWNYGEGTEGRDLREYDILVDCLLGTGFSGEPREPIASAIREINESGARVISADINSGLNGDTGKAVLAVRSDLTVSVGFYKKGMFQLEAEKWIGKLCQADIGIVLAGKQC